LESVAGYEGLVRHLPRAFNAYLRGALGTLATVLDQLGHDDEAAAVRRRTDDLGHAP